MEKSLKRTGPISLFCLRTVFILSLLTVVVVDFFEVMVVLGIDLDKSFGNVAMFSAVGYGIGLIIAGVFNNKWKIIKIPVWRLCLPVIMVCVSIFGAISWPFIKLAAVVNTIILTATLVMLGDNFLLIWEGFTRKGAGTDD